jgi:hypothetical protein
MIRRFLIGFAIGATAALLAAPAYAGGGTIVRDNQGWTCNGPVDLALVRVTTPPGDGLTLASGCTGRIDRIEITGVRNGDGIKVQNASTNAAHDLVIGGGVVSCSGSPTNDTHQDGIQAMGGRNIELRNLVIDCYGGGGGNLFIKRGGGGATTPTSIVCVHCAIGPHHPNRVRIESSISSGLRDSLVCRNGRAPIVVTADAVNPVNTNNVIAPSGDPRCANVQTMAAWIGGAEPEPEPEPEPEDPTVDELRAEIARLETQLANAAANAALLQAEIARLEGLLAEIADLASAA